VAGEGASAEPAAAALPDAGPAEADPADAGPADADLAEADAAEADPADEETGSSADDTVVARRRPPGYQPTQLSIPVARISPAASASLKPEQAKPAQPRQAPRDQGLPQQAQPKPSFTAAKPAVPTFSAASPVRPARPATPPPVTPPDNHPVYGPPGGAGAGYPAGGTTPFGPSSGNQYAGPSQSYSGLAGQYTPGAGGGRAQRGAGGGQAQRGKGGRGRIVWLAVAVLIAVAVGVGAAVALHGGGGQPTASGGVVADTATTFKSVNALNDPSSVHPSGWWTAQLAASDLGSTAGFSMELPPGWREQRAGLATDFIGPGGLLVEVDLTAQGTSNMLTAAQGIEHTQVAVNHKFPGYKRVNLQSVPVRNTHGAIWKFTWTPAGQPEQVADDILFEKQTSAGVQDYAIYIRSPESAFATTLTQFDQILQTFQTVPATTTLPPSAAS
jgi:hypothetical protein